MNLSDLINRNQGLVYQGTVTAVPGANQFTIPTLANLGAGKFSDATDPYFAFVFRDAGGAGAAPQGERQAVTAYVEATGVFQTAAFTAAVDVGDEILIVHPAIAGVAGSLVVPVVDSTDNILMRDVIGNKADTPAGTSIMTGVKNIPAAVYYDSVLGGAGTDWPIGTAEYPVNNLADAKLIMAARNLDTLVLANSAEAITFDTDTSCRLVGNRSCTITIAAGITCVFTGDFACSVLNHGGTALTINGDCDIGSIASSAGTTTILGQIHVYGGWDNTGGGSIGILGDCAVGGTLTMDGTASFLQYGNLRATGFSDTSTGVMTIHGSMTITGNLTINSAAGSLTVINGLYVGGTLTTGTSVTLTIYGNTYIYDYANGTSGACFFGGDVQIGTGIISNNTGTITINGNIRLPGNCNNTGGGDITVHGDTFVGGTFTAGTATITMDGNMNCDILAIAATGEIYISGNIYARNVNITGDAHISGKTLITGTLTVNVGGAYYGYDVEAGDLSISDELYLEGNCRVFRDFDCLLASYVEISGSLECWELNIAAASSCNIYGTLSLKVLVNAGTLTYVNSPLSEVKSTTINLNQAAASYDLFTGTKQVCDVESLIITMPNSDAGGALTKISIQTNNTTPQEFITNVEGDLANLTAENQLAWFGHCRLAVGKKIQLTIYGGATGVSYVCNVDITYKALVPSGYVA